MAESFVYPASTGNPVAPPVVSLERETPSSVEVTRNAKGDYQWSIKVYCEVGMETFAAEKAVRVDDLLRQQYSLPERSQ